MSVQGCLGYIMERRSSAPNKEQKQSKMVAIDRKLEELRLKRELEDGGELLGVSLTSMAGASSGKSERAKKAKEKFKIRGIEIN